MKNLIIIGAGGHGRVVADIAQKLGVYESIAFLDDGDKKESMGLPIVGKSADVERYVKKADVFVAIGNNEVRAKLLENLLAMGASIPSLLHPSAVIGGQVVIGVGTAVMAGAVINPCTIVGKGVIVNTRSSIDHDCVIGDYAHVSVGACVAGTVTVGKGAWIGAGATIKNNVTLYDGCMVGAGAVVVKDITEKGTYIGVPARKM